MKVKEFNQLKKQVKKGDIQGLKEVISDLTLSQAQLLEDALMDLPLDDEMNKVLDELVVYIDSLVEAEKHTTEQAKKVANTKAPQKQPKTEKVEPEPEPEKVEPEPAKTKKVKTKKLFDKVKVGDTVQFQVEGEEVKHDILVVYKGKNNLIAIMADDETEVFNVRKADFNKGIFSWTDRKGETYNIIVIL